METYPSHCSYPPTHPLVPPCPPSPGWTPSVWCDTDVCPHTRTRPRDESCEGPVVPSRPGTRSDRPSFRTRTRTLDPLGPVRDETTTVDTGPCTVTHVCPSLDDVPTPSSTPHSCPDTGIGTWEGPGPVVEGPLSTPHVGLRSSTTAFDEESVSGRGVQGPLFRSPDSHWRTVAVPLVLLLRCREKDCTAKRMVPGSVGNFVSESDPPEADPGTTD